PCPRLSSERSRSTVSGRSVHVRTTRSGSSTATGTNGPRGSEMATKKSVSPKSESASKLIDARIKELGDWRGKMLSRLRALVKEADPDVVEEWKWEVPV